MFVAKSRRVKRKHPAKTSAPTSLANHPNHAPDLPSRIQSEVDLLLPPPYAALCPPGHRTPPQSYLQPPRPHVNASTTNLNAPPPQPPSQNYRQRASSSVDLSIIPGNQVRDVRQPQPQWQAASFEDVAHGALCDLISSKLDSVITSIDGEEFGGDEEDLVIREDSQSGIRGGWGFANREVSRGANRAISSAVVSTNYFAKANLYANSKLPPNLLPLKLYLPSYPLLCLAAQYSTRAYNKPSGQEREAFVNADWRMGTKTMIMKSVPIDDMNCIVFAIRGSQTFMDWAVNLNSAPVAPTDFLDDPGNLCHSGFLSVARKMIKPVAARLRQLLEEDPSRSSCSLLMTGHSAGGAVASLLYAHMLAEAVRSELNILTGCFKRIHCLTFGTPPISLLPLTKPTTLRYKKSLFMSFINEGDPVPRADRAYIRSLLNLYASPAPGTKCILSAPALKPCKQLRPKPKRATSAPTAPTQAPIWKVPPGTLSNAGRLIVLREKVDGAEDDVKAEITCDQELRSVVFGDPVMHMMKVYARRVEVLATKAVTAKIWG